MKTALAKSLREMGKAEYAKKGGRAAKVKHVRLARKVARAELRRHPEYRRAVGSGEDSSKGDGTPGE